VAFVDFASVINSNDSVPANALCQITQAYPVVLLDFVTKNEGALPSP
jgi:hypothetical protein